MHPLNTDHHHFKHNIKNKYIFENNNNNICDILMIKKGFLKWFVLFIWQPYFSVIIKKGEEYLRVGAHDPVGHRPDHASCGCFNCILSALTRVGQPGLLHTPDSYYDISFIKFYFHLKIFDILCNEQPFHFSLYRFSIFTLIIYNRTVTLGSQFCKFIDRYFGKYWRNL